MSQERYCGYCSGDHRGIDCPVKYPKSADEELSTLVGWLDKEIDKLKDNELYGKNFLIWIRSIIYNKNYR